MTRWEYKTLIIAPTLFLGVFKIDEMDALLNRHGGEGWEISGVIDMNAYQGATKGIVIILKRPLPQPVAAPKPS